MIKFLICFLFVIVNRAASADIDPVEVKHLAQFLLDFSHNYCGELEQFATCVSANADIFYAFYAEVIQRKGQMKKEAKGVQMFDKLAILFPANMEKHQQRLQQLIKQKIKEICQFAASVLTLFEQKAYNLLEKGGQQKELLANRRGLTEEEFYKYQLLAVTFAELAGNDSNSNSVFSDVLKQWNFHDFAWALESNKQVDTLKLHELKNPLEIKRMVQLMVTFAGIVSNGDLSSIDTFLTNPFTIPSFVELLSKFNAQGVAAPLTNNDKSFFGQLSTFAAMHSQDDNPYQFGYAVCRFVADVLELFLVDANGAISQSKIGHEMLVRRGLDAESLAQYEYLAKLFRVKTEDFQTKNAKQPMIYVQKMDHFVNFLWNVENKKESNERSTLKLGILKAKRILVNSYQIDDFIQMVGEPAQCLATIDDVFAHFSNSPGKGNAIFSTLAELRENILNISLQIKENDGLRRHILCYALYAFGTLTVYGAVQKAQQPNNKSGAATSSSHSQQLMVDDVLMNLVQTPSDYRLADAIGHYRKLAESWQQNANLFGTPIIQMLGAQSNLFKIVKVLLMDQLVRKTEVAYDWKDGLFPLGQ